MFIHVPTIAACFKLDVSPAEKMIVLCCAAFSYNEDTSQDGEFTLPRGRLAFAGLCDRTLYRALRELERKGILERIKNRKYKLTLPIVKPEWINLGYVRIILDYVLPYNQKLVALIIVKHINKDSNYCYPKIKTIASIAGISERQVRRTVAKLVEMKMLFRYKKSKLWCFEFNDNFSADRVPFKSEEQIMKELVESWEG